MCPGVYGIGFWISCHGEVSAFVLDRGAHVELAVPALAVVPDLEVLEDGVGQLQAGVPALPIRRGPGGSTRRLLPGSNAAGPAARVANSVSVDAYRAELLRVIALGQRQPERRLAPTFTPAAEVSAVGARCGGWPGMTGQSSTSCASTVSAGRTQPVACPA